MDWGINEFVSNFSRDCGRLIDIDILPWLKPRAILKIPHTKAKNITCGFNHRTQRISITIIRFTELTFDY